MNPESVDQGQESVTSPYSHELQKKIDRPLNEWSMNTEYVDQGQESVTSHLILVGFRKQIDPPLN